MYYNLFSFLKDKDLVIYNLLLALSFRELLVLHLFSFYFNVNNFLWYFMTGTAFIFIIVRYWYLIRLYREYLQVYLFPVVFILFSYQGHLYGVLLIYLDIILIITNLFRLDHDYLKLFLIQYFCKVNTQTKCLLTFTNAGFTV